MSITSTTEFGKIHISSDVIKEIAMIVAKGSDCIKPAKKDSDFCICNIKDGRINLTLAIKIKQGIDAVSACNILQNKIINSVIDMAGVECQNVNFDILGFYKD